MDISSQEIEATVKLVVAGMGGAQTSAAPDHTAHPAVRRRPRRVRERR